MTPIIKTTPEALAEAYVWWQPPDESLRDPAAILRQILNIGTPDDYASACRIWGEQAFRDALVAAPPGALDERSWTFWHRCYHLPVPPFPRRRFT
jgi:hypothetical protein